MTPDVAVVSYGAAPWLANLLASLRGPAARGLVGEVHVWENASPDASPEVLERYATLLSALRVHRSSTNLGHGPALDRLLRETVRARHVLVLDSDSEVEAGFGPLPDLSASGEVFAGQVHPEPPQLYAYLCHLLLDREAYLALPPFDAGGAPGLAFFAAVEERGLAWRRLPFRGLVRHHGQGSLRALVRRGERRHRFHAFATESMTRDPAASRRAEVEGELERRLRDLLAGAEPPPLGELGAGLAPAPGETAPPRAARHRLPAALLPAFSLARRARRLGLGLSQPAALALAARLRRLRPSRVAEAGTRHGGALFLASRTARSDARLVTVDLPDWELDDPDEASKRARTEALVASGQELRLRRADPASPETVAWAAEAIGGPADLLLLDARRLAGSPDAAAAWTRLVRPGGLVAAIGGPRAPDARLLAALAARLVPERAPGGPLAVFRA